MSCVCVLASYDSTLSSVPTPDMSVDFYQHNVTPQLQQPVSAVPRPQPIPSSFMPDNDPFSSPLAQKTRVSYRRMTSKQKLSLCLSFFISCRMTLAYCVFFFQGARSLPHVAVIDTQTFRAPNPLRESLKSLTSRSKTSATSQHSSSKQTTTPPPYPSSSGNI